MKEVTYDVTEAEMLALKEVLEVAVCNAIAVEGAYFKEHPNPFSYVEHRVLKQLADDIQRAMYARNAIRLK